LAFSVQVPTLWKVTKPAAIEHTAALAPFTVIATGRPEVAVAVGL